MKEYPLPLVCLWQPQCGLQDFGKDGGEWHQLAHSPKTNAAVQREPQGDFALCCGLLIPLYAARATEEVFYGRQGVTLGTAPEVSFLLCLSVCQFKDLCDTTA